MVGTYCQGRPGWHAAHHRAYVFRTTDGGATYGQVAKLTAADAATPTTLAISVAIDGDTVGDTTDDDRLVWSGLGLRLPHDRRRHVRPGGQADGLRRPAASDHFGIRPRSPATRRGGRGLPRRRAAPTRARPTSSIHIQLRQLDADDCPAEPARPSPARADDCPAEPAQPTKQVDDPSPLGDCSHLQGRPHLFGVGGFVCLDRMRKSRPSAKKSPAVPEIETPPMLRTTSVLPMGTVEAVQAPDADAAPPILGEVAPARRRFGLELMELPRATRPARRRFATRRGDRPQNHLRRSSATNTAAPAASAARTLRSLWLFWTTRGRPRRAWQSPASSCPGSKCRSGARGAPTAK